MSTPLADYPVIITLPVQWGDQDAFQHDILISVLLRIALEGDRQAIKDIFDRLESQVPEAADPLLDEGAPIDWPALLADKLNIPWPPDPTQQ